MEFAKDWHNEKTGSPKNSPVSSKAISGRKEGRTAGFRTLARVVAVKTTKRITA